MNVNVSKYTLVKLSMSAMLVVLAGVCASLRRTPYAYWALAGMALGMVGDICLAKLPWVKRALAQPFLAGMAAFALGHVCYIAAFGVTLSTQGGAGGVIAVTAASGASAVTTVSGAAAASGVTASNASTASNGMSLWWVVVLEALFALAVWAWVRRDIAPEERPLVWALLIYVLLITAMAALGASLSASTGVLLPLLGGALFLISDALIALHDFANVSIQCADALIWATYVPAQLCVVTAGFFL